MAENIGEHMRDNMYGVFALFILVAGNYLGSLLSCGVQRVLKNYQAFKHLVAFMTMYFFVIIIDPDNINLRFWEQLIIIAVVYLVFIMLTKCHATLTPPVLLLFFVLYGIKMHKQYNRDKVLSNAWQIAELSVEIITLVLLVAGVVWYCVKKKRELQGSFKWSSFIFGTPQQCASTHLNGFYDAYANDKITSILQNVAYSPNQEEQRKHLMEFVQLIQDAQAVHIR